LTSSLGWIDSSESDQRRMREIVSLFSEQESRDELGIGQVRDALSDALFPGTSVIQTRARYFLFVPWLFNEAARNNSPSDVPRRVEDLERRLIKLFLDEGELDGLIGRLAGPSVKILPSSIYWTGLQQWGIINGRLDRQQVAKQLVRRTVESDELAIRSTPAFASLPKPPKGFPKACPNGLSLTFDEASWLRDRIATGQPEGTMLAHLATRPGPPDPDSDAPWNDPSTYDAPDLPRQTLGDAELFSLAMQGPALLYNLMIAEHFAAAGHDQGERHQQYRDEITNWADEVSARSDRFARWDTAAFWQNVRLGNPRIGPITQSFIQRWIDLCRSTDIGLELLSQPSRLAVEQRELSKKGSQARLRNAKLLNAWSGASGAGRLTFRWSQVRRLITDIHDGLEVPDA
jgi:hypothetical protein